MKRNFAMALVAVMSLAVFTGCDNKENKNTDNPTTKVVENAGKKFVGNWYSDRPSIDITEEGDNKYAVFVHWSSSAEEVTQWNYYCTYESSSDELKCKGSKLECAEDGNGEMQCETKLQDIDATFKIKNDVLTWNDLKENQAEDIEFKKTNI